MVHTSDDIRAEPTMPDRRGRERTCSRKFRGEIRQINGALAIAGIGSRPRSRCRDGKSPAREDPRARRARASHTCRRSRLLSPCGCAPVDQRVAAAIGCHCTACYTQPRTAIVSALPRIAVHPDRIADARARESAARRDLRLLGPVPERVAEIWRKKPLMTSIVTFLARGAPIRHDRSTVEM